MGNKKRILCINDLADGLTKDKVYEVENFYNTKQGLVFYCIIDDYGKLVTCDSLHFMDTKQVIISGSKNYNSLLTPYWWIELYKRKGKELYLYKVALNKKGNHYYRMVNNLESSKYNDFNKTECTTMFSLKNIGETTTNTSSLISPYELSDTISREDKDLIDIAKEINDETVIKVVYIPIDVDYYIKQYECDLSEYIVERHREWF